MEKTTKIFALLLVFAVVFMTSCNKDDELGNATPEQAEEVLNDVSTQMEADMLAMQNSDGVEALMALMELDAPFFGDVYLKSVKDLKNITKVEETEFGTYEWDPSLNTGEGGWEYDASPDDELILIFPTEGSSPNNAQLTVSNLQFVEINYNMLPTTISFEIVVDNVTQVELNATIAWTNDGMPTSVIVDMFLNPYTITGSFTLSANAASAQVTVSQGSTTVIAAGLSATFGQYGLEESPTSLDGYLQYRTVKLQGNIQMAAMEEMFDSSIEPTVEQMNALFTLSLIDLESGTKLGDFMVIEDEIEGTILAFVFPDGTVADNDDLDSLTEMIQDMVGVDE